MKKQIGALLFLFSFVFVGNAAGATATSFRYPVGDENGNGWLLNKNGLQWLELYDYGGNCGPVFHPGIDFNKDGTSGDQDLGEHVYAVADGQVLESYYEGSSTWGNIILIEHILPSGEVVFSQYGHLDARYIEQGEVTRGALIGTVGKGVGLSAHLHFEIRKSNMAGYQAKYFPCGESEDFVKERYYDPIAFIESHLAPISLTISQPFNYRVLRGPNTFPNYASGDRLLFGALEVYPSQGTTVLATQGDVAILLPWYHDLYPNEFSVSIPYDESLTGPWTLTATNGSNTVTAMTPDRYGVGTVPFLRNVQLIGIGLTPTVSWTVPSGTSADRVSVQVLDGISNARIYESSFIPITQNSFTAPANLLEYDHPYAFRVKLEETEGSVVEGPFSVTISRSETFINFTPLKSGQPEAIFLPTVSRDTDPNDEFAAPFMFDIDVTDGLPCLIDPFVAVGYDYEIGAEDTVQFASVTLPSIGDNLFNLYLFDTTGPYLTKAGLGAGEQYNFPSGGVNKFRVLGIEKLANLDPTNTTAFITELTFTGTGQFTGTMTPIVSSAPEPGENQPPVANAGPDRTLYVGYDCMASVTLDGTASTDPDEDILTYTWTWSGNSTTGATPTFTLPLGTHTITLTVDDGKGGTATDTVNIAVEDNTPPEISVSVSPDTLWPPNHKMVICTPTITLSDNCGADPTTVQLFSVTSNESDAAYAYDPVLDIYTSEGYTDDDIQIVNGDIYLRAERSGEGDGRIYTITYRAADASGNSANASATVTVPHNQ